MKAAIIKAAGEVPVYGDFNEPALSQGMEVIISIHRGGRRRGADSGWKACLLRATGSALWGACGKIFGRP
jgi:hypothetical protein